MRELFACAESVKSAFAKKDRIAASRITTEKKYYKTMSSHGLLHNQQKT